MPIADPSLRDEVQNYLDRFAMHGMLMLLQCKLRVCAGEQPKRGRAVRCVAHMRVPERETGQSMLASEFFELPWPCNFEIVKRRVFGAILARLAHEAAEGLAFDGRAIVDPHARPRVWPWEKNSASTQPVPMSGLVACGRMCGNPRACLIAGCIEDKVEPR